MKMKIPLGISDFKSLKSDDYYFVDKSLLIKEVIEDGAQVLLFARPRRFGKTLNMSMLKYFFDINSNSGDLFKGLKITEDEEIMTKQGKYPVIYLTFKDEKYSKWENTIKGIEILVSKLYENFDYLLNSKEISDHKKEEMRKIIRREIDNVELSKSILNLCELLYRHHNSKVVILVDEYDVPIQSGYIHGFYDEIIEFMRNFLSGGLKDNPYLEKAVITGILRISKESIFSGLNNLKVNTMLNEQYSEYFGFTEGEVEQILDYYGLKFKFGDIRDWYNGYLFGKDVIYNPWSVLYYTANYNEGLKPYWVNTSTNDLVKILLTNGGQEIKKDLEDLIKGDKILKRIDENIILPDVDKSSESVWSFLLYSGYLKASDKNLKEGKLYCNLTIPNNEVMYLYKEVILSWITDNISINRFETMIKSLLKKDIETFEEILSDYVFKSASYFDIERESEKFYHALVLGMLIATEEYYHIKSNRESGLGRYDIMMIPKESTNPGIIIEFKKVNTRKNETLETAAQNALTQIENQKYRQELVDLGIKEIIEMAVVFEGKEVLVKIK
ncbi:putative AAA-ATPase [Caloramator mitchellensis]|uniref:Putative AAA-ATPase n=1 Tax=Caloramator mitchellensis TaxID=908809 RepID=A0A0R3K393_CALMK|nr:AAA family ATPase [Caloramator mitchellensis]KRQ87804.1 putative AAA-ATPase [Caloramator mitchellensis]